jgi:LmbE family N-acetylglucosaminyl deacetylase
MASMVRLRNNKGYTIIMFKLNLFALNQQPKILCLGAHPDDIEIGCGATLLRIIDEVPKTEIYWVVFSGDKIRQKEATESATNFLAKVKTKKIFTKDFRESYFPYIGEKIKDYFEELEGDFRPDIIFTHYVNDAHQDHRSISNLTWNTFRDNLILEYEIPKYDGDLSIPNVYAHVNNFVAKRKISLIMKGFPSQKEKKWFNEKTFQAILTLRGIESNSPTKYAEAFHCRKIIF